MTDEQWYEIEKYFSNELKPVNVVRETAKCVFIVGRYGGAEEDRHQKQSVYSEFVKGWENAHARALEIAEERLNDARRKLEKAQGYYGNIKNMKRPSGQVIRREK